MIPWGAIMSAVGSMASSYMGISSARGASNTSYQRAMRDMRKAGLNPILAYSQGGASTPVMNFQNPAADVEQNVATAKQTSREKALADSVVNKNNAEAAAATENALSNRMDVMTRKGSYNLDVGRTSVENALKTALEAKARAETGYIGSSKQLVDLDKEQQKVSADQAKALGATLDKMFGKGGESTWGDIMRIVVEILKSQGPAMIRGGRR